MHLSSLRNNLRIAAGEITPGRFGERRVGVCSGTTSCQKQKIQLNPGGGSLPKYLDLQQASSCGASFGLAQQSISPGPYKASKTAKVGRGQNRYQKKLEVLGYSMYRPF